MVHCERVLQAREQLGHISDEPAVKLTAIFSHELYSVVTWGRPEYGGDSSVVADKLSGGVVSVHGNAGAFAAIKDGGAVVGFEGAEGGEE